MVEYTCFIFSKVGESIRFVLIDETPGKYMVPILDIDENQDWVTAKFIEDMRSFGLEITNPDKHILPFGKDEQKNKANVLVKVSICNLADGLYVRDIEDVFDNIDRCQQAKFYNLLNELKQKGFFQKTDLPLFRKMEELRSFGKEA